MRCLTRPLNINQQEDLDRAAQLAPISDKEFEA